MTETIRFGRFKNILDVPALTELHVKAYDRFLQRDVAPDKRVDWGLESILRETFPIKNYDGTVALEYVHYEIGQPRYTPEECRMLRLTYGAPLKVRLRLVRPEGPIEEDVYLGEIPLMIGGGAFIVNGAERVLVNQLHRSPGIDFMEERVGDRKIHSCWIVPERGSWIEISVTKRDSVAIRIDQGGKIPATTFLRACSPEFSTNADIIRVFHETQEVKLSAAEEEALVGKVVVQDVVDPQKNEKILASGQRIAKGMVKLMEEAGLKTVEIVARLDDTLILNTLEEDDTHSHEEALLKIYGRLRPGTPQTPDKAKQLFYERFFDPQRYRLGRVGRFRLNRKFGMTVPETEMTVQKDDVVHSIKYIMKMRRGEGAPDDIDHLGNRRVRTIDELAGEEVRKGFLRLKRSILERLNMAVQDNLTPKSLINSKTVSSAIEYFFGRSELSQVIDQTNPLSQLTHERRLSALGPGGLNRKRAGFEVRDVHISHYGRVCPIETPEGTNIGLISSLAIYASVDDYGFLTAPYRVVKNGRITDEVVHLRADEEVDKIMAPADVQTDKDGRIHGSRVMGRVNGEFQFVEPEKIQYVDVSPAQIVGVSASLIPFLEHDDANRALMGSNMQRQAVPLVLTEPPVVATGMERYVAENSDMVVKAQEDGVVRKATATEIVVRTSAGREVVHRLRKYYGLNERTCLNQKPIVREGDRVRKGQVIADGPSTCQGELALGRNVLVAFMPWDGYNFEDAIIVSERLVKEDAYTSIHIEEFEVEIRETKLGKEEFTRDIPNVSEKMLRNLNEDGVVKVGTRVKAGDILVGKVAPKSKSELTPEEKLLHAIFGRAGEDVKNESLEVPSGVEGIVIDTRKFFRKTNLSPAEKKKVKEETRQIEKEMYKRMNELIEHALDDLKDVLGRAPVKGFEYGPKGSVKDLRQLKEKLSIAGMDIKGRRQYEDAEAILRNLFQQVEALENEREKRINQLTRGEELPTGVLEMVKVYVATKRNLSVGDKVAGRHGNKGVIARILPEEDMPFLEDGTPVDIVLNPLGVPSRMNVGQILETHLGWACRRLGLRAITPPFDGAKESEIEDLLEKAGLPRHGKVTLHDGRTGEPFDEKVTVGVMYIMKLHHLVDDKIHARATGPYSLITQQPLGGKARAGGQRFGEMEVWALEAYGAANVLQELLTVKSDDVDGRTKIYESMVRGENILEPGTPVSFEVLCNEIKGLGLSLKLEKQKEM
ncbi:MAG TPA: DNA-directed RNA polymerase subunit beta [Planctomycetota bacterium]|jgi:DNA-directed RNA polymerase subunit beta|nr:DNA-directed RNA polymerase subunit beta [Planctomycetota bacterium]